MGKKLILDTPSALYTQTVSWAKQNNASDLFIELLPILWETGVIVGIDPILMIAQCAKETGYCKFGGVLDSSFKNTCGLKINNGGEDLDPDAHARFKTWEDGAMAQAQHLALYAGKSGYPLKNPIDTRHFKYLLGKCRYVHELSDNWAVYSYGQDISKMMDDIRSIKDTEYYIKALVAKNKVLEGKLSAILDIINS